MERQRNGNPETHAVIVKRLWPYALFLILVCIFLWKPIFRGDALLPGDYLAQMSPWNTVVKPSDPPPQWNPLQWDAIAQFYPWRVFYARSMAAGHIPLWNPHQFCGTPFLANGQSAVLYPFNAVFLLFDPITAFTVLAALHLFLAQVFMYWLLRELGCRELGGVVGAICFAFSAFMVLWLELPTFVGVAVWLPLALLLIHRSVERKSLAYGMFAGAVLALSFLAGHLQIAFYVALASMLWWIWRLAGAWRSEGGAVTCRRVLPACAAFVIVAGLIASAQVLPTEELGSNSHRVREVSSEGYERFIDNALRPYRLVTAIAPDFYGNPSNSNYYLLGMMDARPGKPQSGHAGSAADYMEYGMYVGILPLILACIALGGVFKRRHAGFFAFLGIFSLLIALGTVLNWPFYYFVPGFSAFGGPNRILLLYVFSVAALAGFGADLMAEHYADKRFRFGKCVGHVGTEAGCIGFLVAAGISLWIHWLYVNCPPPPSVHLTSGAALLLLLLSPMVLGLNGLSRKTYSLLIVLVIIADLFAFGINYNPTCSRDKVYPRTQLTDTLKRIAGNSRIAPINPKWSLWETPKAILPPNAAMVYGLYDVQGYDSLYTKTYKDLSSNVQGVDSSPPENGNLVLIRQYTPGVGTLAGLVLSRGSLDQASLGLRLVGNWDGVNVYRGRDAQSAEPAYRYEPFSFRLGLFLSLIGVACLSAVVAHRIAARKGRSK